MRLTNFLVRDAIIPNLSVTAGGVDPRDSTAVAGIKQHVIAEMVTALRTAGRTRRWFSFLFNACGPSIGIDSIRRNTNRVFTS